MEPHNNDTRRTLISYRSCLGVTYSLPLSVNNTCTARTQTHKHTRSHSRIQGHKHKLQPSQPPHLQLLLLDEFRDDGDAVFLRQFFGT